MYLNSYIEDDEDATIIPLRTYDDAKLLALRCLPASPYSDDLCFEINVASPSVQSQSRFQVSIEQVLRFVGEHESSNRTELQDVNGDGLIAFEKIDSIGHLRVSIKLGSPWSDQARVTFETDQTAVVVFAEDLQRLVES